FPQLNFGEGGSALDEYVGDAAAGTRGPVQRREVSVNPAEQPRCRAFLEIAARGEGVVGGELDPGGDRRDIRGGELRREPPVSLPEAGRSPLKIVPACDGLDVASCRALLYGAKGTDGLPELAARPGVPNRQLVGPLGRGESARGKPEPDQDHGLVRLL